MKQKKHPEPIEIEKGDIKRILVAIPSMNGFIPCEIVLNLLSLQVPEGHSVNFTFVKRQMVDKARNVLAQGMLNAGYDYLLFVDDDTILPVDTLVHFLELDKPIVGAPVPSRRINEDGERGEGRLCLFENDWKGQLSKIEEARKVGGCGMSCTLIKREVLADVATEFGKPFKFETIDKVEWHEDTNFCRMAGLVGYETWATPKVRPEHMGEPVVFTYTDDGIQTFILPS